MFVSLVRELLLVLEFEVEWERLIYGIVKVFDFSYKIEVIIWF